MIVVINPSAKAGHSFKGLHAYCSHDQERAKTSERVEWIDTRNIGIEDSDHAWKIMAATAQAQNQLKQNSGIRAGKAPKDGAVMHVILSFHTDEPQSREDMQAAADELLAQLGADPAKMRSKNKPKLRQFADEHQAVLYAHSDTENGHLHMMINRIHPQTGLVLPTNNDHIKAQAWALDYSMRHGTDEKTPARQENKDMRENGEYVKADKRKTRNAYEQDQKYRDASNDNHRLKSVAAEQLEKDAALAQHGRTNAEKQANDWNLLVEAHKERKSVLGRQLQTQINNAKAAAREEYRPHLRELRDQQEAERRTFESLEASFFGRAANAFKTVFASPEDIGGHRRGFNVKTFQAATNAGGRKQYFDEAQERARKAVEREQALKAERSAEELKIAHAASLAENREHLTTEREDLKQQHFEEAERLKSEWRDRNAEREQALEAVPSPIEHDRTFKERAALAHVRKDYRTEFDKASQPVPEQDNEQSSSGGDDAQTIQPAPEPKTPEQSLQESYADMFREKLAEQKEQSRDTDRDDQERE